MGLDVSKFRRSGSPGVATSSSSPAKTKSTNGNAESKENGHQDPDLSAENASQSADVELNLLDQQLDDLFKFKILLLGAGESGKSTVVKQLKLIHKKKVSSKELQLIGTSLHQNVIDCMKALIHAAKQFGYYDSFSEEDKKTESMLNIHNENDRLRPEEGQAILELYKSEGIKKAYDRRDEFWLLDSFPYYIKNLPRFVEPDFIPTEEDNVMARIRTTGIIVSELEHKIIQESKDEPDSIRFQVVDVGGQRNERKKWIHCFSDVKAILFIVNMAGYNQVLFEDSHKNRIIEELELFEKITTNPTFADTPIFLFLNKKDLFESMVTEVDMKKTFTDYTGGKNLLPAMQYMEEQFKKRLPNDKAVQVHTVAARWKRDIRGAFDEVKKLLYDMNKKELLAQAAKIKQQRRAILEQRAKIARAERRKQQGLFGGCFSKEMEETTIDMEPKPSTRPRTESQGSTGENGNGFAKSSKTEENEDE